MGRFFLYLLLFVGAAAAVVFVAYQAATLQNEKQALQAPPPPPPPPQDLREFTLYFGHPSGTYLVAESRQLPECTDERLCLSRVVGALLEGSQEDLLDLYPPSAGLLDARIEEDIAVLNFSSEFRLSHPGGTLSELLTLYGLVDTVAVNFSYIKALRLLVEGEAIASIKGHVDLRDPVGADFRYTRPPERLTQSPASGLEEGIE